MQTDTLQRALEKLEAQQLSTSQVRRVAVTRRGVLHIEIQASDKQRFFFFQADELQELQPYNDPEIPLLGSLSAQELASQYAIVSYRPGRRIVLDPIARQGTIAKAYKKHQAKPAADKHAIAIHACHHHSFDIPELLQSQPGHDHLVLAKRSGQPLAIAPDAVSTWGLVGTYLQHFQQFGAAEGLQEFDHQQELQVLDERARRLLLVKPDLPQHWQAGRENLDAAIMSLPPTVKALAHRDLHDRQFIIGDKTVVLLDFDLLCHADTALDAGNLLAHMQLRVLQGEAESQGAAFSTCCQSFLAGLGRQNEAGFEQRLLFYQATTYYRLALLYALRPRWKHLTSPLIDAGKQCIDKLSVFQGSA